MRMLWNTDVIMCAARGVVSAFERRGVDFAERSFRLLFTSYSQGGFLISAVRSESNF